MTIRNKVGAVVAPFAPSLIIGAERDAVIAMGPGSFYWKAYDRAFTGLGSAGFRWAPRVGEASLTLANDDWPDFVDGEVPYVSFNGTDYQGLQGPDGSIILPQRDHAVFATVYQPVDGGGVVWGNRANITVASDGANNQWSGLITGILGNPDRLTYSIRGQSDRTSRTSGSTLRDGNWHVLTTLYRYIGTTAVNQARLRVDGVEVGDNDVSPTLLASMQYRELRVGIAGATDASPLSPFKGRINALAVVPENFVDGANASRLADIEGHFASLVGTAI